MSALLWWVDGTLRSVDPEALASLAPAPRPESSAYTTARVTDGQARWHDRHVARLSRDAGLLGLGRVDASEVAAAFRELGRESFGSGSGIVRLQMIPCADSKLRLVGIPRPLGAEPRSWSAMTAQFRHDGPTDAPGAKLAGRALFAKAHEVGEAAGVDEVLLLDESGRLIEGARSNLFVVDASGALCVPDLCRGGVAGIAREILCELALPALRDIHADELASATELIATNAVRGACSILRVDGKPVGCGEPGPVAVRLEQLLQSA